MRKVKVLSLHRKELNEIFSCTTILGKVREQDDLASIVMDSLYGISDEHKVVDIIKPRYITREI